MLEVIEDEALPPAFITERSNIKVEQMSVERYLDERIAVQPWLIE